jgi:putative ABC transport system ATP-binding protein
MLVEIRDLAAGYEGVPAVDIARLDIATGEHTLVLGPSGCGKTTLLNVLGGLMTPLKGRIKIAGVSLADMPEPERDGFRGRHIGLVMQRLHLIGALSVADNLLLAQRLIGKAPDPAAVAELLASLGLEAKAHKMPRALSQGEAQRVAVARATLNRPQLIVADEPTSALDDANCAATLDLLFGEADRHGATLVVATHDARIQARFAHVVRLA